jgi:hypothetical protein
MDLEFKMLNCVMQAFYKLNSKFYAVKIIYATVKYDQIPEFQTSKSKTQICVSFFVSSTNVGC